MKLIEAEKAKDVIHEYFKSLMVKDASGVDVYKLAVGIVSCLKHDANLLKAIDELPSIQPERKTGRWIYRKELSRYGDMWSCSEYNEKTTDSIMGKSRPNFCPLCGADMRGERDD